MRKLVITSLSLVCLTFLASDALAALEFGGGGTSATISGTTYSIGNGFTGGSHPEGSHFHSSNLEELPAGNPPIIFPGAAEVGGFFGDEEIRGISEFHLEPGETVDEAVLRFDVLDTFLEGLSPEFDGIDGLFGQGPLDGVVDVFPYLGDGSEAASDYQATPITAEPILSIVVGDGLVGGDTVSVDITTLYNDLVTSGDDLGIRLQMANPDPDAGAVTFHNFRIDVDVAAVPEPSAASLAIVCAIGLFMHRRSQTSR